MNAKSGKSSIVNLILLLVLFFGIFALVKHLGANFTNKQIAKNVKDRIALERGADFTEAKGMEIIRRILADEGVIFDEGEEGEVDVTLDNERQRIEFYFRYEIEINFIFFKKRRVYEVEDEMPSYS